MRQLFITALMAALCCHAAPAAAAGMLAPQENPGAGKSRAPGYNAADCNNLPPAESTKLGLIRQMLKTGKPHAAIAYLDAARISAPQAELLRADGLRQTGRENQAAQLYQRLLGSCVDGYAYQGLGLIASKAGKLQQAVNHLRAASAAMPVDASIRNDYGYALMLVNEGDHALHEFLTALELTADNRPAAHNLFLLLTRQGNHDKARLFAEKFGLSQQELARLRLIARDPLPSAIPEISATSETSAPLPPIQTDMEQTATTMR